MKKNGNPSGARGVKPAAAENLRNRKTYLNRLEEMGLDEPPAIKRGKMPSAIELARVAAADAPFVEEMAGFVVSGLCLFDKQDWTRHCHALIGLLDDAGGAVPGVRTSEHH